MVEELVPIDAVFQALANGARRDMIGRLAESDLTVGELAQPLTMTLAAASKHIKVLERVGLVRQTVSGRQHVCHLEAEPLASVSAWLRFYERFWTERLDAMGAMFQPDPPGRPAPPSDTPSHQAPTAGTVDTRSKAATASAATSGTSTSGTATSGTATTGTGTTGRDR